MGGWGGESFMDSQPGSRAPCWCRVWRASEAVPELTYPVYGGLAPDPCPVAPAAPWSGPGVPAGVPAGAPAGGPDGVPAEKLHAMK